MSGALDWLFLPLRMLATWLLGQPEVAEVPPVLLTVALFLTACFVVTVAFMLGAVSSFYALLWTEDVIESAHQRLVRGSTVAGYRRAANRFVRYRNLLRGMRRRTGVSASVSRSRDVEVLSAVPRVGLIKRTVCEGLLFAPIALVGAVRAVGNFLRTRLGIYLLAGSAWVGFGLRRIPGQDAVMLRAHEAASPEGVGLLALLVAAAAVLLDHGLTPRLRSRNEYIKTAGVEAEGCLHRLALHSRTWAYEIDEAVEEVVRRLDAILSAAVEIASDDRSTAYSGKVQEDGGRRFGWRNSLGSGEDDPIVRAIGSAGAEWAPGSAVAARFALMVSELSRPEVAHAVRKQAPRLAFDLLIDLEMAQWRSERESERASDLPVELICLERPVIDSRVQNLIEDMRRRPEELQGVVSAEIERWHYFVWDAMVKQAEARRFAAAVLKMQSPRGPLGRLSARLGV